VNVSIKSTLRLYLNK